nr:cytokine receptor-like factor 2 isoform X1 [Vicugna pacos]
MRRVFLAWAGSAVFLLGHWVASGEPEPTGEPLQLHIINFNFETVQVTWNASEHPGTNLTFFYKLRSNQMYRQCSNYIFQQGYTSGCLLLGNDEVLHFSIRNGTCSLLTNSLWTSTYLKPRSPRDLSFQWHQGAVTVVCPDLLYKDLLYEIQYKSTFDTEWQSKEAMTCNVTIGNLDAEKCYFIRARIKTLESSYGSDTYPSDWSAVVHQQRGQLRDSCQENKLFPNFVLIAGLVTLLMVSLLLLSIWKLQRIKKVVMPSVPDPKFTFSGLFESHQGNFQEWIRDTQNVAHLNKVEDGEQECIPEEAVVVQPAKTEAAMPKTTVINPVFLPMGEEEAAGDMGQLPCQHPQGGEVVSLGGFTFVMSDNAYMMF